MVFMIAQDLQLCIDEGHSNSKDIFFLSLNLPQHPHEIDLNKETNVSCLC